MANVLVAGATGVLGREVTKLLQKTEHKVRTLSKDPDRAKAMNEIAHEVVTGDATIPGRLNGLLDGIDVVISCLGAPVLLGGNDKRSYRDIDTIANKNLLAEAERSGVTHFVYVSIHIQEGYANTAYVKAHEEVVDSLQESAVSFAVVQPTGVFSMFDQFLDMARRGVVSIPGDGSARTNPVDGLDVAAACIDAISKPRATFIEIGGPDVFTRGDIVRMAFDAVGRKPRIIHIPSPAVIGLARAIRPFHPRYGELFEFATRVFTSDCVAPKRGERRLVDHFARVANGKLK